MDTHGHEECARDAGRPQLAAALGRVGKNGWRLEAFYLGNWLTDVSQAVDPVAYAEASGKVDSALRSVIRGVRAIPLAPDAILDPVAEAIEALRERIHGALGVLRGGRSSPAGRALKKGFLVIGYFKFVHPSQPGQPARMDYDAFKHVFDQRYTQYYPHEHLDRWPKSLTERGGIAAGRAGGTITPDGRGTGSSSLNPHIYSYLREDLEIAAGLLASVDQEWARLTFDRGGPWTSDGDPAWNEWLAKLGHALHALEDYFAHSNFIELALKHLGDAAMLPRPAGRLALANGDEDIFLKRLKRYSATTADTTSRWRTLTDEDYVATGYFDFVDTIHSISHVAGDLWDQHGHGGGDSHWDRKIGRYMRTVILEVKRRTASTPTVTDAQAGAIARQVVTDQFSHGDPDARQAADELLHQCPAEVRDAFFEGVGLFCMKTPGVAITLYDAIETASEFMDFIEAPFHWLADKIRAIPEWIKEQIHDIVDPPLKQLLDTHLLGRFRVGCHSLMAKDYAWESNHPVINQIYRRAKNCSKGVHWYVVKTITRWSTATTISAPRTLRDEAPAVATVNVRQSVDWLELVECLLRHPAGQPAPHWWEPVVRNESFTQFPGYNGTSPERLATLPHQLLFVDRALASQQATGGDSRRATAEGRYVP